MPMERYGVADVIGRDRMYPTLPTAVEAFRAWDAAHPAPAEPAERVERARTTPNSTLKAAAVRRFARLVPRDRR
jgi:hypothetical protein